MCSLCSARYGWLALSGQAQGLAAGAAAHRRTCRATAAPATGLSTPAPPYCKVHIIIAIHIHACWMLMYRRTVAATANNMWRLAVAAVSQYRSCASGTTTLHRLGAGGPTSAHLRFNVFHCDCKRYTRKDALIVVNGDVEGVVA